VSSTGRGQARIADDVYPTPGWTVDRLLEGFPDLPGGLWVEPCVGSGAIVQAVLRRRSDVTFHGLDIRNVRLDALIAGCKRFTQASFTTMKDERPAVVITNPPYTEALEVVQAGIGTGAWTVMLLRLNFLGSENRAEWLRAHPPDIGVLPNRPSFAASLKCDNKKLCGWKLMQSLDAPRARQCPLCTGPVTCTTADSIEYGWFVWPPDARRASGKLMVLATTPEEDRQTKVRAA